MNPDITSAAASSTDYCGGRSCGDDIARALQLVSGRWGVPVLEALVFAGEALRFRELQRRVGAISQKELARHLAAFVAARVLTRHQDPLHATRVHYALSERGRALLQQMDALGQWAQAPWRESSAVTRPAGARGAAAGAAATWLGRCRADARCHRLNCPRNRRTSVRGSVRAELAQHPCPPRRVAPRWAAAACDTRS